MDLDRNTIKTLSKEQILDPELLDDLYAIEDLSDRSIAKAWLLERASELRSRKSLETALRGYDRVEKQVERDRREREAAEKSTAIVTNRTNFLLQDTEYINLYCGSWMADEYRGVYMQEMGRPERVVCPHPIFPVGRLENIESGMEKLRIAFKRNGSYKVITVKKSVAASANKIVALSDMGVSVTSETAKYLVQYLSDVEAYNEDTLSLEYSTTKLGWISKERPGLAGDLFVPYDTDIQFDGDSRFMQLYSSVREQGSYEIWLQHMRELRASGRLEVKFLLAAAFASILVKPLGVLPFWVDLWGETEGGKTVALMVAASVWADPAESRYIGDFKSTDVALEAKADMLNHLPMLLDDTSKRDNRIRDNFESIIYNLTSGKGKSRSNKELGLNRENNWQNIIICNGERPLSSYVNQGGAMNRILEVEARNNIFSDPQRTASIVKANFGHAGKIFVETVRDVGPDRILEQYKKHLARVYDNEKMQKQSISLAVVLTADQLVDEYIFQDGNTINVDEARTVLMDHEELSDAQRCYHFVCDKIAMNGQRFDDTTSCEKWGFIESGIAYLHSQALQDLCDQGDFSMRSFLSWARTNGKVEFARDGKSTKLKRRGAGAAKRYVWLHLPDEEIETDADGFISVADSPDGDQEMLPFD